MRPNPTLPTLEEIERQQSALQVLPILLPPECKNESSQKIMEALRECVLDLSCHVELEEGETCRLVRKRARTEELPGGGSITHHFYPSTVYQFLRNFLRNRCSIDGLETVTQEVCSPGMSEKRVSDYIEATGSKIKKIGLFGNFLPSRRRSVEEAKNQALIEAQEAIHVEDLKSSIRKLEQFLQDNWPKIALAYERNTEYRKMQESFTKQDSIRIPYNNLKTTIVFCDRPFIVQSFKEGTLAVKGIIAKGVFVEFELVASAANANRTFTIPNIHFFDNITFTYKEGEWHIEAKGQDNDMYIAKKDIASE
jgi:hypothetical protein